MLGIVSFWYLGNKTSIKKIRSIDDYVAVATLAKQITGLHPISSLGREHHKCWIYKVASNLVVSRISAMQ